MLRFLLDRLRHRRAASLPISATDWQAAEAALPFLAWLPEADRPALRDAARLFISAKQWHGAHGLVIEPAMQLQIALQACLPVLKLGLDWYDGWTGIVIYPGDFVIPRQVTDADGVVHEYDDPVLGEAWEGGPVLLSWFPADDPDNAEREGINVVIHEFAHKLDMCDGVADGMPPLPPGMSARRWIADMEAAYDAFCAALDRGEETWLDPYAAEAPAEFFAVCSEAFFTTPLDLLAGFPAVYAQLASFYRQDPSAGTTDIK